MIGNHIHRIESIHICTMCYFIGMLGVAKQCCVCVHACLIRQSPYLFVVAVGGWDAVHSFLWGREEGGGNEGATYI